MKQHEKKPVEDDHEVPLDVIPAYKLYWMADEGISTYLTENDSVQFQTWFLHREE